MTVLLSLLGVLGLLIVLSSGWFFFYLKPSRDEDPLIEEVNRLLPQTQCAACGYPGCRPYAEALVLKDAPINLCQPGQEEVMDALSVLLSKEIPDEAFKSPFEEGVVWIREEDCIGCTKCIKACPVNAIVGAPKLMHTILAVQCTGCDLCIPVCPTECIVRVERKDIVPEASRYIIARAG